MFLLQWVDRFLVLTDCGREEGGEDEGDDEERDRDVEVPDCGPGYGRDAEEGLWGFSLGGRC